MTELEQLVALSDKWADADTDGTAQEKEAEIRALSLLVARATARIYELDNEVSDQLGVSITYVQDEFSYLAGEYELLGGEQQ